jgi:ArsR family transcriptional regulator
MKRPARPSEPFLAEDDFLRIAKALSERRRVEILEILSGADRDASCQEIGHFFSISQATLSHHLKELAEARLLIPRKKGTFCFYQPNDFVIEMYMRELRRRIKPIRPPRTKIPKRTRALLRTPPR